MSRHRIWIAGAIIYLGLSWIPWTISSARAQDSLPADACMYLPPSFADRVVFYHGFERGTGKPEINLIHAELSGSAPISPDGFAGAGCHSLPDGHERPLEIRSPRLSVDRPITVMRWWRIDAQMKIDSSFQLLALLGKGHISCFVRGKGEWCALQRPTMFVQIDHFPAITNVNWRVKDNAYFQPGEWHHSAITVANGSEVCFYLDGQPLVTVHAKGRQFNSDDINVLQPSSDSRDYSETPTTTDDLIVVDRVLSAEEIEQYCHDVRKLKEMKYPSLVAVPPAAAAELAH